MSSQLPVVNIGEQPIAVELPPRPSFARRVQRAHDLSARSSSASELLTFYARLASHQERLFEHLKANSDARRVRACSEQWLLDLDLLGHQFPAFATSIGEIAPFPMARRAAELAASSPDAQTRLLAEFWANRFSTEDETLQINQCIALSFLQPYAELLASLRADIPSASGGLTCPICASKPLCAVLRDQSHGASRSIVCSLCMNEWNFLRVVCPACGEDRFEALAIFASDQVPHVRIDSCDSCLHYIKTIDLTKDGLAVPVVDELASVSLDLWAAGRHYQKCLPNLLGL